MVLNDLITISLNLECFKIFKAVLRNLVAKRNQVGIAKESHVCQGEEEIARKVV